MTINQLLLAAALLDEASDRFSNHGCNDWEWPADWTDDDKLSLLGEIDNGYDVEQREQALRTTFGPPDWLVMSTLADMLRKQAETMKGEQ